MRKREFRTWDSEFGVMIEQDTETFIRGDGKVYALADDTHDTPHVEIVEIDRPVMFKSEDIDDEGQEIWESDVVRITYIKEVVLLGEMEYTEFVLVDSARVVPLDVDYDTIKISVIGNIYEKTILKDMIDRKTSEDFWDILEQNKKNKSYD